MSLDQIPWGRGGERVTDGNKQDLFGIGTAQKAQKVFGGFHRNVFLCGCAVLFPFPQPASQPGDPLCRREDGERRQPRLHYVSAPSGFKCTSIFSSPSVHGTGLDPASAWGILHPKGQPRTGFPSSVSTPEARSLSLVFLHVHVFLEASAVQTSLNPNICGVGLEKLAKKKKTRKQKAAAIGRGFVTV